MGSIFIYTDGAARGNPGPAGAGAYITDSKGEVIKEVSKYLGEQTNNFAEYEGVILGLKTVKKLYGKKLQDMEVEVRMDSELIQKQLSDEYQIKEETLFPQYIKVHNLTVKDVPNVKFVHVPRNKNKEADRLANEGIDNK